MKCSKNCSTGKDQTRQKSRSGRIPYIRYEHLVSCVAKLSIHAYCWVWKTKHQKWI